MTYEKTGYRQTPFVNSLRAHMNEWREDSGSHPLFWPKWTDGIYPEYRTLVEESVRVDSVKLHGFAAHILSSQVFAFNLFLPFREGSKERLSHHLSELVGTRLTVDSVNFEWVPPGHLLGELEGEQSLDDEPATAVDVVLWSRLECGKWAAVLVEVKLSEGNFTHCGGRDSRGNRRKDLCKSAKLFFDDPNVCYLRRPLRKRRDRRYWEIFAASYGSVRNAFPSADLNGSCPFAYDMQQPMRNFAIAHSLVQEDMVEQAWFALCAHDANPDIAAHWEEWKNLLADPSMAPSLLPSEIVAIGEAEGLKGWAEYMRARYSL